MSWPAIIGHVCLLIVAAFCGWVYVQSAGFGCAVGDYPCDSVNFGSEFLIGTTVFAFVFYTIWAMAFVFWICVLKMERMMLKSWVLKK